MAAALPKNEFLLQYSKYKIIQLYTHAADTSSYGEPVIYFSDSILYLSELITENKPYTRLIILSACETGVGKLYEGEGVFSFNRGFAALGIPAAITNLWSIDNKSTYKLTELFYKYLVQGLPSDVALQKAKLEILGASTAQNTMPYYWAAPILVGQAATIELDPRSSLEMDSWYYGSWHFNVFGNGENGSFQINGPERGLERFYIGGAPNKSTLPSCNSSSFAWLTWRTWLSKAA